jgi:hypothetical protein
VVARQVQETQVCITVEPADQAVVRHLKELTEPQEVLNNQVQHRAVMVIMVVAVLTVQVVAAVEPVALVRQVMLEAHN